MMYKRTTQIPNILLDHYLPHLSVAELKILLVIIRQTYGWIDKRTGRRKTKDRISFGQFISKTGLSRRAVSYAIKSLSEKDLINISCHTGTAVKCARERRGKPVLIYSVNLSQHVQKPTSTSAKSAHNKTNYSKLNALSGKVPRLFDPKPIKDLIEVSGYKEKYGL